MIKPKLFVRAAIFCASVLLCPIPLMAGGTKESVSLQGRAFTGDGGTGKSIAILAPNGEGLSINQEYLPALVQGELVSVFSGYSAMSVLDREHLDEQYAELFSGYYDDNAHASGDMGHLTPTDYILGGSVTRTATGYALQMRVLRNADKMIEASYSGSCTFIELDNLSAIRRASVELLGKMGVELTEGAVEELSGAAARNHVEAQTARARGVTAEREGATIEAMSYYYQAVSFEPALRAADPKLSTLAAQVTSGLGTAVKNDIEARRDWLNLLKECVVFMREHPPFELVYDPGLEQIGVTDYAKETASFTTYIAMIPTESGFQVINDLLAGLNKTGRRTVWGFDGWPFFPVYPADPEALIWSGNRSFSVTGEAALVNADGKIIGRSPFHLASDEINFSSGNSAIDIPGMNVQTIRFSDVNANDLTGSMTVRILTVNDKSAEDTSEAGYMRMAPDTSSRLSREGQRIIKRQEQERQRIEKLQEEERQRIAREAARQSSPIKPVYGVGFAPFSVYSSIYGPAILSLFPEIGLDIGKFQLSAFADYTVFWRGTRNDNWPKTLNFGANAAFWLTHNWSIGIGYGTGGEFDNWNIKSYSPFIRASLGMVGLSGGKRNYSFIKVFYDYYLHDGENYRAGILFGPGLLQAS